MLGGRERLRPVLCASHVVAGVGEQIVEQTQVPGVVVDGQNRLGSLLQEEPPLSDPSSSAGCASGMRTVNVDPSPTRDRTDNWPP